MPPSFRRRWFLCLTTLCTLTVCSPAVQADLEQDAAALRDRHEAFLEALKTQAESVDKLGAFGNARVAARDRIVDLFINKNTLKGKNLEAAMSAADSAAEYYHAAQKCYKEAESLHRQGIKKSREGTAAYRSRDYPQAVKRWSERDSLCRQASALYVRTMRKVAAGQKFLDKANKICDSVDMKKMG